jgi:hypothetical protein
MKSCHEVPFKVPQQRSAQIIKWPHAVDHHATNTHRFLDLAQTKQWACVVFQSLSVVCFF